MIKQFKKAKQWYYNRKTDYEDDLTIEADEVVAKIFEYGLEQEEIFTLKVITDYKIWRGMGINIMSQRAKVVEAVIKFGKNSLFWSELDRTKIQRATEWMRVAYLCKEIKLVTESGNYPKGITKSDKRRLTQFFRFAVNFRRKLLINPLTEDQWKRVWVTERILGIYYDDLTPEENGEIWRIEALKELKRKEK